MSRPTVRRLTIAGEPVGKARPRVTRHGTYTPAATRKAEAGVALAWTEAHADYLPTPGARHGLAVTFYRNHRYQRDLDNLVKLLMDALNGHAWEDDHQVEHIRADVRWVAKGEARTELAVWELGAIPALLQAPRPPAWEMDGEPCPCCGA